MQRIARQIGELLFVFRFLILIWLLSVDQHPWDVEENEDLLPFYQQLESVQYEQFWPIPSSTFSDSFDPRAQQLNFRNPWGWKIDYFLWTVPFLSQKYWVGFATSFFLFSISPSSWSFEFTGFHSSSPVMFCSSTSNYKRSLWCRWTHSIDSCQTSDTDKKDCWGGWSRRGSGFSSKHTSLLHRYSFLFHRFSLVRMLRQSKSRLSSTFDRQGSRLSTLYHY